MRGRTTLVVSLGLTQTLAWGSSYYLPAILSAPMADDLGVSTGSVYGAFSLALIVTALLGPAAGQRIDRHGGRNVLAASNLLFAVGLLSLGLAQGPASLWFAWLIIGIGMAIGLYDAAFATLAGIYGREARGPMTGITLLAGFASTVCWPITGWLDAAFGWRLACFVWAAAHLGIGLPLNRFLLPRVERASEPQPPQNTAENEAVPTAMALLTVVFAITWIVSTAMAAHLPRLLEESGLAPATAIALAALVGPAQVAARLAEFTLLRPFHPLVSARLASAAHPLGALAVMVLGAPAAVVFTALHGAGNGILTVAKGTLPLAIFGPRGYGRRQGWLMAPARFGQALAPFLFALLIERFGSGALAASAALSLLAFGALSLLHSLMRNSHATSHITRPRPSSRTG